MAMYYVGDLACDSNYLEHFGIRGMKWGIRRYQNPDGTLTEAGKKHYGSERNRRKTVDMLDKPGRAAYEKLLTSKQVGIGANIARNKKEGYLKAFQDSQKAYDDFYNSGEFEKHIDRMVERRLKEDDPDLDLWTKDELKSWYTDEEDPNVIAEDYAKTMNTELAAKMRDLDTKKDAARKAMSESAKEYVDTVLGEYGSKPLLYANTLDNTRARKMAEAIVNRALWWNR